MIQNELGVRVIPDCNRLETANIRAFHEQLSQAWKAEFHEIEVDLSEVQFIDGSGIGGLLSLFRLFGNHRGTIILSHPQAATLRFLEMLRLDRIFLIRA